MGLPKPSRRRTRSLLAPPVRGRSPAASRLCPPHNWADRRSCPTPFIRERFVLIHRDIYQSCIWHFIGAASLAEAGLVGPAVLTNATTLATSDEFTMNS